MSSKGGTLVEGSGYADATGVLRLGFEKRRVVEAALTGLAFSGGSDRRSFHHLRRLLGGGGGGSLSTTA